MSARSPATRVEIEDVLRCGTPRPSPVFLPAIYEHKAWFVGSTPSAVSRDADLLSLALLAEYEALNPDALVVGIDVYNVEAEACGCPVTFYDGLDTSIPGIKPGSHVFDVGDDLSMLRLPNPLKEGRMPVNLSAARKVRRAIGAGYWIRGAVSGPFSLAISLVGAEELFVACLDRPEWVHSCLRHCGRIIRLFARAYIDAGVELIMFDSQASPELLSPSMYEEFVLPETQEFIAWAATQGVRDVPLVVGGDTTTIAAFLCRTGANNLLCDFNADFDEWSAKARASNRALRRNIPPRLLATSTPEKIYDFVRTEVHRGKDLPGFIMGTGVIPFGTPTANILAAKQACIDA
jgi:uroporphyrinogen decarboxylase